MSRIHGRGEPKRLLRARAAADARILARAECEALAKRIEGFAQGGGPTEVDIGTWWNGEMRWGRNRVSLAGDRRDVRVRVVRRSDGRTGEASTNQLDDVSLEACVRAAERTASMMSATTERSIEPPPPALTTPTTTTWSDTTYDATVETTGAVARQLVDAAESKEMLSAGYVEVRAGARWVSGGRLDGPGRYDRFTQAQCSLTVRDSGGTGSGWAGLSSFDWGALDTQALGERALEKALASRNPVSIEPGRYVVILEPQAVADLMRGLTGGALLREPSEDPAGVFWDSLDPAVGVHRAKLGLKVMDERITIEHDPADPLLGILSEPGMAPVKWVDRGVLMALAYDRKYAVERLAGNAELRLPLGGYRMSGGETTIDEMVRTTRRGLLVTRFSNIGMAASGGKAVVLTGLTRDGLWLVENGKISKAVKNLRFTESPLFMLNSIDQLGPPVPVFNPVRNPNTMGLTPIIVPPIKARDFSFTSAIDAV